MNKSLSFTFVLMVVVYTSFAQVGISFGYSSFEKSVISDNFGVIIIGGESDRTSGLTVAVDYWFRLKQKRLEFLPTLFHTNHYSAPYDIKNYGLQFRTTIYPFDFQGDCNCPTFSKENELFKKGFFFRLAPGISRWTTNYENQNVAVINNLDTWTAELSGAMGLDIGITNLLTISPELALRRTFKSKWNQDADYHLDGITLFEPKVRIGLRFDKKNYGFKRPKRRRR